MGRNHFSFEKRRKELEKKKKKEAKRLAKLEKKAAAAAAAEGVEGAEGEAGVDSEATAEAETEEPSNDLEDSEQKLTANRD